MKVEGRRRDFPYRRLFLLAVAFVLALTLYLHFFYFPRVRTLADREDRQFAVAQVTGKRVEREEGGQEAHRLTFRFRTADGRAVTGEARVEAPRYHATEVGEEVFVEYSLKEPRRHRLMEPSAINGTSSERGPSRRR